MELKNRRFAAAAAVALAALVIGAVVIMTSGERGERTIVVEKTDAPRDVQPAETDGTVVVYVTGAVAREGVYELPKGSRIADFVEASGGFTEDADKSAVNLALIASDGTHLRIPRIGETVDPSLSSDGRIDLNTADEAAFMTLSGIGEAKAKAIVQYRLKHGRFSCIEDLLNVSGIGQAIFENIRDQIKV